MHRDWNDDDNENSVFVSASTQSSVYWFSLNFANTKSWTRKSTFRPVWRFPVRLFCAWMYWCPPQSTWIINIFAILEWKIDWRLMISKNYWWSFTAKVFKVFALKLRKFVLKQTWFRLSLTDKDVEIQLKRGGFRPVWWYGLNHG